MHRILSVRPIECERERHICAPRSGTLSAHLLD